jgi:hypothetical protein
MAAVTQALGQCLMAPQDVPRDSLAILSQQQCRTPNSRCMLVLHGTHKQSLVPRLVCPSRLGPAGHGCQMGERAKGHGQVRHRDCN